MESQQVDEAELKQLINKSLDLSLSDDLSLLAKLALINSAWELQQQLWRSREFLPTYLPATT